MTFATAFREETCRPDAAPSADWSTGWASSNFTPTVRWRWVEPSPRLELIRTTTDLTAYTCGSGSDVEALARLGVIDFDTHTGAAAVMVLRQGGSAGAEDGYTLEILPSGALRLNKHTAGAAVTLGTSSALSAIAEGVMVWLRFRADGTALKARGWVGAEPTTWDLEVTDSAHTTGNVGLASERGTSACDYFSFGTAAAGPIEYADFGGSLPELLETPRYEPELTVEWATA